MPGHTPTSRNANINIRVAPEQRSLIDQAASLNRETRTAFILNVVTRAAEETLLDQVLFHASAGEFERFRNALDSPSSSNDRLRVLLSRAPGWNR